MNIEVLDILRSMSLRALERGRFSVGRSDAVKVFSENPDTSTGVPRLMAPTCPRVALDTGVKEYRNFIVKNSNEYHIQRELNVTDIQRRIPTT